MFVTTAVTVRSIPSTASSSLILAEVCGIEIVYNSPRYWFASAPLGVSSATTAKNATAPSTGTSYLTRNRFKNQRYQTWLSARRDLRDLTELVCVFVVCVSLGVTSMRPKSFSREPRQTIPCQPTSRSWLNYWPASCFEQRFSIILLGVCGTRI